MSIRNELLEDIRDLIVNTYAETGNNYSRTTIAAMFVNSPDSSVSNDITVFGEAVHSGVFDFSAPIYDTGRLSISTDRVKFTNSHDRTISFTIDFHGRITSTDTGNSNNVGVRINSSNQGLGTGSTKVISAGQTLGGASLNVGFATGGAFTLGVGDTVALEVSKNFTGNLVVAEAIAIIRMIY